MDILLHKARELKVTSFNPGLAAFKGIAPLDHHAASHRAFPEFWSFVVVLLLASVLGIIEGRGL